MRTLTAEESVALLRHLTQRRELLVLEREELSFRASNNLIERIVAEIGDGQDDAIGFLLKHRANNHIARARRSHIMAFVRKLLAAKSATTARAIEGLKL